MNSATRLALINATSNIVRMTDGEAKDMLLKLLSTNPTIVMRAVGGETSSTYSVVVEDLNGMDQKINAIKIFREVAGFGLADSKAWSEGMTLSSASGKALHSGVFAMGLTYDRAMELKKHIDGFRHLWKIAVVKDGAKVMPLPYTWSQPRPYGT